MVLPVQIDTLSWGNNYLAFMVVAYSQNLHEVLTGMNLLSWMNFLSQLQRILMTESSIGSPRLDVLLQCHW